MGLQSALSTALTGLQAAETTIDVTGNNVANSNTVGFKESSVLFATQFLRTLSIGSSPSEQRGGTNPRQIGLGVKVAAINPNFAQGTIEISTNPLDVAIQGDGFLIVQSPQGEFYTRAGQLSLNASNQIVTPSGNRVLGYTVDEDFVVDRSNKVPLDIPLGSAAVAQETENAFFSGTLSPQATVGDRPEIINSQVLGNGEFGAPGTWALSSITEPAPPGTSTTGLDVGGGAGTLTTGTYQYRVVYATEAIGATTDASIIRSQEGSAAQAIDVDVLVAGGSIDLSNIPTPGSAAFTHTRLYRSDPSVAGEFRLVGEIASSATIFSDNVDAATWATGNELVDTTLDAGNYSYYATFFDSAGGVESRPSQLVGARAVSENDRRMLLTDIPTPATSPGVDDANWDRIRIYRNLTNDSGAFHLVGDIPDTQTVFVDSSSTTETEAGALIDLDGPPATQGTILSDLTVRDGNNFTKPFENGGVLSFAGKRGGRTLSAKEFTVTPGETTLNNLVLFMEEALGIHSSSDLSTEPFPDAVDEPGIVVNTDGQIVVTSNHGVENELSIGLTALQFLETGASTATAIGMSFSQSQDAIGEGATADFVVYDSLGIPLKVTVSTVLESRTSDQTTYRWLAYSEDNEPLTGVSTAIGNGIIRFDNAGNVLPGDIPSVAIQRNTTASQSPLEVALDFSEVSGLNAVDSTNNSVSSLNVNRQDGFPPGVLTSFIVTESGLIRGIFSNGTDRPLGQLLMARFANNTGLAAEGDNLFAVGVNSGDAIIGEPGLDGLGTLLGGAVELSNTDIGQNLIELILASTQYRGNARVITTTQELLDELLALSR